MNCHCEYVLKTAKPCSLEEFPNRWEPNVTGYQKPVLRCEGRKRQQGIISKRLSLLISLLPSVQAVLTEEFLFAADRVLTELA